MSTWKFNGIRQLEKQLTKKVNEIGNASTDGLLTAANYLLEKSLPLVPVDTGRLKASGKILQENNNTVYVAYEAFNPDNGYDYAPIQHEDLFFNHNVGQAKYLEEPFYDNLDILVNIISNNISRGVDK